MSPSDPSAAGPSDADGQNAGDIRDSGMPGGPSSQGVGNPFPGLRPYDERDADSFFGRDDQIHDVFERLRLARFVAVVGASGCGKSSLVRAGILPILRSGFLADSATSWRIAVMRPQSNPIAQLAHALLDAGLQVGADIGSTFAEQAAELSLRSGRRGIVELFQRANLPEDAKLLVLVDQFEELFRFAGSDAHGVGQVGAEARAFVSLLLEAAEQPDAPICVMLTMRSEFLGDCNAFVGLPEAINEGLYLVPRLTRDQLREAIEEPIHQAGAEIENRLVNELLNGLGDDPDQLPILQHALMRLWGIWDSQGRLGPISLDHYTAIGTLKQSLELHLQEIYSTAGSRKPLVERMFRELTQIDEHARATRRPRTLAELRDATGRPLEEVADVIKRFRRQGRSFLTPLSGELTSDTMIDISHESLIRQWSKLKGWAEEEAADRRVQTWLAQGADEWHGNNRNPNRLLTGVRLEEAKEWSGRYGGLMRPVEREFLDASLAARNREIRFRTRAVWMTVTGFLIAVLLGVVAVAFWITDSARAQTAKAEADAKKQAADAVEAQRSAVEREQKYRLRDLYVERGLGLFKQGDQPRSLVWLANAVAVDPEDAPGSVCRLRFANVLRRCPRRGEPLVHPAAAVAGADPSAPQGVYFAQFVRDGNHVVTAAADGKVRIWDLAKRRNPDTFEPSLPLGGGQAPDSARGTPPRAYEVVAAADGGAGPAAGDLRILLRTNDVEGAAWIWGVKSNRALSLPSWPWKGKFSPDGRHLATCDRKGTITLWDVESGTAQYSFSVGDEIARAAAKAGPAPKPSGASSDATDLRSPSGIAVRPIAWQSFSRPPVQPPSPVQPLAPEPPSPAATQPFMPPPTPLSSFTVPGGAAGLREAIDAERRKTSLADGAAALLEFTADSRLLYAAVSVPSPQKPDDYQTFIFAWALEPKNATQFTATPQWREPVKTASRLSTCCALPSGSLAACGVEGDLVLVTPTKDAGLRLSNPPGPARSATDRGGLPRGAATTDIAVLSPDGRLLAAAKPDRVSLFWATDGSTPVTSLPPHAGKVQTLAFSPDGRRLLTGGAEGRVKVWDLGPVLSPDRDWDHLLSDSVTQFARHPAGLALNDEGQLEAWDFSAGLSGKETQPMAEGQAPVRKGRQLVSLAKGVSSQHLLAYSPESARLFSCDDGNRPQISDATLGTIVGSGPARLEGTPAIARFLAAGRVVWVALGPNGGHQILEVPSLKPLPFDKSPRPIVDVVPSENERVVALAFEKIVQVWDVTRPSQPAQMEEGVPLDGRSLVAVSNDGRSVVFLDKRKQAAQLWIRPLTRGSSPPGKLVTLDHAGEIKYVAFDGDNKYVVSCSADGTAKVWDLTGKLVSKPLESGSGATVSFARFSDDSRFALTTEEKQGVYLWDVQSGGLVVGMAQRYLNGIVTGAEGGIVLCGKAIARQWTSPRDDRDAKSLVNLAQSLSGFRLAPQSLSLTALSETSPEESGAKDARPADSFPAAFWHRWQASDCLLAENGEAAVWHLTRYLATLPEESRPAVYAIRGAAYLALAKKYGDAALVQRAMDDLDKARTGFAKARPPIGTGVPPGAGVSPLWAAEIELNSARAKMLDVDLASGDPQRWQAALDGLQAAAAMIEKASSWEAPQVGFELADALDRLAGKADLPQDARLRALSQARSFLERQRTARPESAILRDAEGALADAMVRAAEDASFAPATRASLAGQAIELLKTQSLVAAPDANAASVAMANRRLARALLAAANLKKDDSPDKIVGLNEAIHAIEAIPPERRTTNDLRRLASAHQALGRIAGDNLAAARKEYGEAVAWRRRAAAADDAVHFDLWDLADAIQDLGRTLVALGETAEADKACQECLTLVERGLLKRDDAKASLAGIYLDLGVLSKALDDVGAAYGWWIKARQAQSELANTQRASRPESPEKEQLALVLERLAEIAREAGHAEEGVEFGRQCIDLRSKRLAALNDADSRLKVASGDFWMAYALDGVGRSKEAIGFGDLQIALLRQVQKERNDQAVRDLLFVALRTQGARLLKSRSLADARQRFEDARKEAEAMASAAPKGAERLPLVRLAEVLASLAVVDREAGDFDAALKSVVAAIARYEQALGMAPSSEAMQSRASAYEEKAGVLLRLGLFAEARTASGKSVELREELSRSGGTLDRGVTRQAKAALAKAYGQLARLQLLSGDVAAADATYGREKTLEDELTTVPAKPGTDDFDRRRLRAQSLECRARRCIACAKIAEARTAYQDAIKLRSQLCLEAPTDACAKAAHQAAAAAAAALELLAGQSEKAKDFSQQAFDISTKLLSLDPDDSENQRSLGLELEQLGLIAARDEDYSKADDFLGRAISFGEKLVAHPPARLADRIAMARQRKWQAVCQLGAKPKEASSRPAEVQRGWDLLQTEQLVLNNKRKEASTRLDELSKKSAGDGEALFDVASAAARCAWDATFAFNLDDRFTDWSEAVKGFCQQAVAALIEARKAGYKPDFHAAEKFAEPELDIIRRAEKYKDALPTGG